MTWIVRGVATILTLLIFAGGARAEPLPDEGQALRKGAAYLAERQVPVGGWPSEKYGLTSAGHTVAVTAVAAHALLAAAPGDESKSAAEKAISFIDRLSAGIERGRTHDGYDYGSWGIAYALVHLGGIVDRWPAGGEAPEVKGVVTRLLGLAKDRQRPSGGWDYRERPDGSLGVLTAVMLQGLARWDADKDLLERGFADLSKSCDKDGLLGYAHDGAYEDVREGWWSPPEAAGRTLLARWAELQAGRAKVSGLKPCLERVLGAWKAYAKARGTADHQKPHDIAGYYYHQTVLYAMLAAREISAADRSARPGLLTSAGALTGEILAAQSDDGSWLDSPATGETCATGLALLTLAAFRELSVGWAPDADTALGWGKAEGKPVVLIFTERNEASRRMTGYFYEYAFRPLLPRIVPCHIELDRDEATARRAKVYRGPTIVIADPTREDPLGKPVRKLIGSRKPEKIRDVLVAVLGS